MALGTNIPNAALSALTNNANDIRDIRPPVEIAGFWTWVWWILGIGGACAVLLALWIYFIARRKRVALPPPPIPAHVRAKQLLEGALALIGQPKPFVTAVSDTARRYLEERFEFRAPERTTEEFLHELRRTDLLSPEQKESLGNFLQNCDLVKFARYEPAEPELRELHGAAVRLVEETEPVEEAATDVQSPSAEVPGETVNRE